MPSFSQVSGQVKTRRPNIVAEDSWGYQNTEDRWDGLSSLGVSTHLLPHSCVVNRSRSQFRRPSGSQENRRISEHSSVPGPSGPADYRATDGNNSFWTAYKCLNWWLSKVLPSVFPILCRITIILEKWRRIPAEPLTIAPYSRHVLDCCPIPDLLLCSLSLWFHFLALVFVTLIIWQLSFWHFRS